MFTSKKSFSFNAKDSIMKEYKLLLSKYDQNIKELINNKDELKFILKLYYLFNHQSSEVIENVIERIKTLGLRHVKIENNNLYFPYWIQFNYDIKKNELVYILSVYWIKKNNDLIEKIKRDLLKIEELFIIKAIEVIKDNIENSLKENILLSVLSEIKLNITKDISFENILFILTEANKDCPDYLYQEEELTDNYTNIINKRLNNKYYVNCNNIDNLSEYDLFFECGGIKTDYLSESNYSLQCHGISVKSKEEVDKYAKYLYSNSNIKKAIRNIMAYRYRDVKTGNMAEDYDDFGENYAGIRIIRFLKEIKVYNIFIFVSRFNFCAI